MEHDFRLRTDPNITTHSADAIGTPEDAQKLHAWPGELPEPDEPVTVAIMDTGIHEDLDDHPWFETATVVERADIVGDNPGADKVGHGSGCASIYARNTPTVEFYDVRIFGDEGRTDFGTIQSAYDYLIDHAAEIDVVNMSWGASRDIPQINELHEELIQAGVHDIAAAGNTGDDGGSPATSPSAFSAGAVDENGKLTRFTSSDPDQGNPEVAALGKNVKMARAPNTSMDTPLDEDFVKASGTSFSAPYTGAAYVNAMYVHHVSWDGSFVKNAEDIPDTERDGEGLLKLAPALEDGPAETPPERGSIEVRTYPFFGKVGFIGGNILPTGRFAVKSQKEDPGRYKLIAEQSK